jgi:hypothetical protein
MASSVPALASIEQGRIDANSNTLTGIRPLAAFFRRKI